MQRTIVVTGGSSGIGAACCQRLCADGYQVHNLDVQVGQYGYFHRCDVTDISAVAKVIAGIAAEQPIYGLVVSAGRHFSGTISDTDEAQLDALLALNVKGAYAAVKACLPSMQTQQQGSIVLIASDQALVGKPHSFAYNLTKHALASMAKTTALDFAADNIRCNALCPGTIETPLYHQAIDQYVQKSGTEAQQVHAEEAALQPLGRLGQSNEVAAYVAFLLSAEAAFVTGSLPVIDGGYTTR